MLPSRLALVAALAALVPGCADRTLPPVTSLADPSNPAAPEAPLFPPPSSLGATLPAPPAAPLVDAVYVCPMHAQVIRDAPGACPICGMTLVPRPRTEAEHAHPGDGGAK
jgi:hypothetical protein